MGGAGLAGPEAANMSTRYNISTNPLECDAEVAYIVATNVPDPKTVSNEDEFDFSFSEAQLRSAQQTLKDAESTSREQPEKDDEKSDSENEAEIVKRKIPHEEENKSVDHKTGAGVLESLTASVQNVSLEDLEQRMVIIFGPISYANRQLVAKLVQSNPSIFTLVVPHTSRKRKQTEINGLDFHFMDRKALSHEVRKGNFVECVTISLPKLKPKSAAPLEASCSEEPSHSFSDIVHNEESVAGTSLTSAAVGSAFPVVQMPSPLLSAAKPRAKTQSNLFGTSKEALEKARMQRKPCIVLNVTHKGAEQLKKADYEGMYIMIDPGGNKSGPAKADGLDPDVVITASRAEQQFSELQKHAFHAVSSLPLSPRSKHEVTQDEWDSLPTIEMEQQQTGTTSPIPQASIVTFNDLLVHFQRKNIGKLPTKTKKSSVLSKSLHTEWNLVFSLSETPLSNDDPAHFDALQTIYQKLTGSVNYRYYGPHWQAIGFPGVDPAESLREVGIFGIMQMIYFLDKSLPLALEMFNYSQEGKRQFPFATVSLNMTNIALSSLRDGHLTKLCKKQDQVFVTLGDYYIGIFYRFFLTWKQSTSQMAPIIQDIEHHAKKHPKNVISDFQAYLDSNNVEHDKLTINHSTSNPFTKFDQLLEEEQQHTKASSLTP